MRALPKLLIVLVIAALLVVAGLLWLDVVQKMRHASPVPVPKGPPFPSAIVWGDHVFSSRTEFARWLHSKGASYSHWRKRFPSEAAVLEHRRRFFRSTASPSVRRAAAIARARRRAAAAKPKKAARGAMKTKRAAPASSGARRDVLLWTVIVAAGGALIVMWARAFRLR
jgi:hypothetical protein